MGNIENSFEENTIVILMAAGIFIMLALALAFVLFANFSQKKILREQMRNQDLAFKHQEALLHGTILTQEKERKRIARELHDEIGSKLNVILLHIHRLKKISQENATSEEAVTDIKSLINNTLETTRRISHDLLPPTLEEFGLVEAIKELRDSYERLDILKIDFELLANDKKIKDSVIELNLFRVLQELISNSIKHGKAEKIDLKLSLNTSNIQLEYSDNGKGFDMSDSNNKKGLGMKNIESRLNMIHADYDFQSAPGKGILMKIELSEKTSS